MKVPAHSQAAVRSGFSVKDGNRDSLVAIVLSAVSAETAEGSHNIDSVVLGRKSAVKASRLVCTPTIDVYFAKGKNGAAGLAVDMESEEPDALEDFGATLVTCFAACLLDMESEDQGRVMRG